MPHYFVEFSRPLVANSNFSSSAWIMVEDNFRTPRLMLFPDTICLNSLSLTTHRFVLSKTRCATFKPPFLWRGQPQGIDHLNASRALPIENLANQLNHGVVDAFLSLISLEISRSLFLQLRIRFLSIMNLSAVPNNNA